MDLKYKPVVGVVFLLLGVANLIFALAAGQPTGIFMGAVFTLLGGLLFAMKPVGINSHSVAMRNLLGIEMKRHIGTVEVRDNKVFVGGKKRVSLWMFDANEQAVRSYLQGS